MIRPDMHQMDEPAAPVDLYQRAYAVAVLAMCAGMAIGFVAGRLLP